MRLGKDVLDADLYGELGVTAQATEPEIRSAYRRQVRASHPDLNQSDPQAVPRTKRLNVAARVLLDPVLRRAYDRAYRRPPQPAAGAPAPRRSSEWFERHELGFDDDWAPVAAPVPPVAGARFGAFFSQLRGRDGRVILQLQGALASLSPRQQMALTAGLCGIALLLIILARPHVLTGESVPPTCVDPGSVYP